MCSFSRSRPVRSDVRRGRVRATRSHGQLWPAVACRQGRRRDPCAHIQACEGSAQTGNAAPESRRRGRGPGRTGCAQPRNSPPHPTRSSPCTGAASLPATDGIFESSRAVHHPPPRRIAFARRRLPARWWGQAHTGGGRGGSQDSPPLGHGRRL
eukprot:6195118-Pleurochrysis_carterae.AAC.4